MDVQHQPQLHKNRRNPADRRQQADRRAEARFHPDRPDRRQQVDRRHLDRNS
ncbi:MAG: hypothetical protein V7707_00275 [Motiliproteus sp.]